MNRIIEVGTNVNHLLRVYNGRGVCVAPRPCRVVVPKTAGAGSALRRDITGWSVQSRARFRSALLTSSPPAGWSPVGVTLTIPGPVPSPEEAKKLYWSWSRSIHRAGFPHCGYWRVEVQARGSLHWHLLLWVGRLDREIVQRKPLRKVYPAGSQLGPVAITHYWFAALQAMGPGVYDGVPYSSRIMLPGAMQHAVHVDDKPISTEGATMRYLCDHATKAKQGQIGSGIGRHWGVLHPDLLRARSPDDVLSFPADCQFHRFLRAFQRLATPSIPDVRAPFGRRLGYRIKRGRRGQSVWFSRPDTVRRLYDWAVESPPF